MTGTVAELEALAADATSATPGCACGSTAPAGPASPTTCAALLGDGSSTCGCSATASGAGPGIGHARGPDARTTCSPRTSPSRSIDDPRLVALFAELLDAETSRVRPVRADDARASASSRRGHRRLRRRRPVRARRADRVGQVTVIDAICFALYGSVPRHGDRRAVAARSHVLATEAKVALDVRGRRRALRRGPRGAARREGPGDDQRGAARGGRRRRPGRLGARDGARGRGTARSRLRAVHRARRAARRASSPASCTTSRRPARTCSSSCSGSTSTSA